MSDPHAPLRMVTQFLWVVRRYGVVVSTAQALTVLAAVRAVGVSDRAQFREAVACVVCTTARDRSRFDEAFTSFFARKTRPRTFEERLVAVGLSEDEVRSVNELVAAHLTASGFDGGLLEDGAELTHALQKYAPSPGGGPATAGYFTHQIARTLHFPEARRALPPLGRAVESLLGERGAAATAAIEEALREAEHRLRDRLREQLAPSGDPASGATRFAELRPEEAEAARRAVRYLAEKLRAKSRARARHGRRRRVHIARTLRAAMKTGGVPFELQFRKRRPQKVPLVLVCDVSDSVRATSRYLFEFCVVAREVFHDVRVFAFIGDCAEITDNLAKNGVDHVLEELHAGRILKTTANSNYGRVFADLERMLRSSRGQLHRTTLVVLGDGRTNYLPAGEASLTRLVERTRRLFWFCPEPMFSWGSGDSAMNRYAPIVDRAVSVATVSDLVLAARSLAV